VLGRVHVDVHPARIEFQEQHIGRVPAMEEHVGVGLRTRAHVAVAHAAAIDVQVLLVGARRE
jgi:hypothetical protein